MGKLDWGNLSRMDPLDGDAVAKDLRLKQKAEEQAALEQPASEAVDPDGNEKEIIQRISEHRDKKFNDVSRGLETLEQSIASQRSKLLSEVKLQDLKQEIRPVQSDLNADKRNLRQIFEEHAQEKIVLKEFQELRNLKDYPITNKTFVDKFALLVFLVMVEGFANMSFFAEGNELGYFGAVTIALLISAVNVVFMYAAGVFIIKRVNSIYWWNKIFGIFGVLLMLTFLPAMHLFMAFYRQVRAETESLSVAQGTAIAREYFLSLDFGYLDLMSWLLFGVGVLFGWLASGKGYRDGHRYPGYVSIYRKFLAKAEHLHAAEKRFRDNYIDGVEEVRDRLRDQLDSQSAVVTEIEKALDQKRRIRQQFQEFEKSLCSTIDYLVQKYRDWNKAIRTTPPPAYFNKNSGGDYFAGRDRHDQIDEWDLASFREELPKLRDKAYELLEMMDNLYESLEAFLKDRHGEKETQ